MTGGSYSHAWLLDRVDARCDEHLRRLLSDIAEHVAVATGEAVSVRMLSADGQLLLPVVAHHPTPHREDAMAATMAETTQPADSGLWRPVLENRKPGRYHFPAGRAPVEASDPQVDFIRRYPIRAVIGVPLLARAELVGGLALVRFGVDRPFTDEDEDVLTACGARIGPVLGILRALGAAR